MMASVFLLDVDNTRTKASLGDRVTTVHVRQGGYASDDADGAPPDIAVEWLADVLTIPEARFSG
jgi:hypothetical protein